MINGTIYDDVMKAAKEEEIEHCKWLLEQAKATIRKQCADYDYLVQDLKRAQSDRDLWKAMYKVCDSRLDEDRIHQIRRDEYPEEEYYNGLEER